MTFLCIVMCLDLANNVGLKKKCCHLKYSFETVHDRKRGQSGFTSSYLF